MAARFGRSAFQAFARRLSAAPNVARTMGRRNMSSTAGSEKKSDLPWIVGSALAFGPAFLYLVSPTARKHTPAVHNDQREYPGLKTHQEHAEHSVKGDDTSAPAEVVIKDDEGTEANVGASLALAEQSNSPKSSTSPEVFEETKAAAEAEGEPTAIDTSSSETQSGTSSSATEKSGTFQKPGEEGPTDVHAAQEAAQEGVPPKKHADTN